MSAFIIPTMAICQHPGVITVTNVLSSVLKVGKHYQNHCGSAMSGDGSTLGTIILRDSNDHHHDNWAMSAKQKPTLMAKYSIFN